MFSCTFNVENTKKLIDSQIQIPKVYEDDICIFLALKLTFKALSVFCVQNFIHYYILGSLGVANVGGVICVCDACVVGCVCDVCDVYCVCVYGVCTGRPRKKLVSEFSSRYIWPKWPKVAQSGPSGPK